MESGTDSEAAESALHLQTIETLSGIGGWALSAIDEAWQCSPLARQLLGLPAAVLPSLAALSSAIAPADLAALRRDLTQCLAAEHDFCLTLPLTTADGETRTLELRGRSESGRSGRRVVGMIQALPIGQPVVEALGENDEKFRLLADNLPGTVYLCCNDARYTMLFLNDHVETLTGYPAQMFLDDQISFVDLFHPEDAAIIAPTVERALSERRPYEMQFRLKHRDRHWRWVREVGVGVYRDGVLTHLEGFILDITEQRELEAQFLQAQKMESIGHVAGGIAHDFNNLLSAIIGHAEIILLDASLGGQELDSLQHIHEAGTRAARLTQQLLTFASQQAISPKIIAVNDHLQQLQEFLRRLLGERVTLTMNLPAGVGSIRADPSQFEQVVLNLAINARDAMPKGGRLLVATERVDYTDSLPRRIPGVDRGDYVRLSVSDTGIGMTPEVQARIFEPFFSTKEPGTGGLGLSTCFGIIKQHGGHVSVHSEPGVGTRFDVFWPVVVAPETPTKAADRPATLATGDATILLVEDEAIVRDVAQQLLASCGYTVLTAASGEEALTVAAGCQTPIDLLISDVVMPGMHGHELARKLRELLPTVKVMFISGYAETRPDGADAEAPGDVFMQKPFDIHLLADTVRNLLMS